MAEKAYSIEQEQLARFAKAMGYPAQTAILHFLAKEVLPISKARESQHLKELKGAGLIQGTIN